MPDYVFNVNREPTQHTIPGTGISVTAPGLQGQVTFQRKHAGGPEQLAFAAALRGAVSAGMADPLDQALNEIGVLQANDIETAALTPQVSRPEGVRAGEGPLADDEIQIDYQAQPGEYSFVIYRSEDGALSIHFAPTPVAPRAALGGAPRAAEPRVDSYRIQLRRPAPPAPGALRPSFGLGAVAQKLLKVVVGKVTAPAAGAAVYGAAYIWESRARAHQGFHGGADFHALLNDPPVPFTDWNSLAGAGKKALLFVHGTTSSTSGAFAGLGSFPIPAGSLYTEYGNRVIGFNHHTLTKSVAQNVSDFYAALPAGVGSFCFDIVCHSRGGLVARALKELPPATISALLGIPGWAPPVQVGIEKIVFVGTPNVGTELADPNDIPQALNLLANLAALFPGAGLALAGILSCTAYVAQSGFVALPGLRDMCPGSDFLTALQQAGTAAGGPPLQDYSAIQSSFSARGLLNSVMTDAVDSLFHGALNDLVVPTLGVSNIDGTTLPAPAVLFYGQTAPDSVPHTGYFTRAGTWAKVLEALAPN